MSRYMCVLCGTQWIGQHNRGGLLDAASVALHCNRIGSRRRTRTYGEGHKRAAVARRRNRVTAETGRRIAKAVLRPTA